MSYKIYVGQAFLNSMQIMLSGTEEQKEALRIEAAESCRVNKEKFKRNFIAKWGSDMWDFMDRVMTAKSGKQYWMVANHSVDSIWMDSWQANPDNDYDTDTELGIDFKKGKFIYGIVYAGGYGGSTIYRDDLSMSEVEEFMRVHPRPACNIFETK